MSKQLIIGYTTEGKTDIRFLESIIQRTFEDITLNESNFQIDVLPVQHIEKISGSFIDVVRKYSEKAHEMGIMILCIHNDSDNKTDDDVFKHKINPAFEHIQNSTLHNLCKNLVPVIPIQMMESWMLADKVLLKKQLGTTMNDTDLGVYKKPEIYSNPKEIIEKAILIAFSNVSKKRKNLNISDLYSIMGQSITLDSLRLLPSFSNFENTIKDNLKKIGYLH